MSHQQLARLCPKCGLLSSHPTECPHCGIIFARYNSDPDPMIEPEREEKNYDEVFYDQKINLWSLPVGLGVSFLIQQLWFISMISSYMFSMPLHEFGHGITAWMMGMFAIPIPVGGFTMAMGERSILVSLIFFGAFSYLAYKTWREKFYFLCSMSVGFILTSVYLLRNFKTSIENPIFSFGGVAGEFILATILILSFYHPMFKKIRWDFFRYIFFVVGCMAYVQTSQLWINIYLKREVIPFGSAISADGAAAKDGDMNRLITAGWTETDITSRYMVIFKITLLVILAQYIYRLLAKPAKS